MNLLTWLVRFHWQASTERIKRISIRISNRDNSATIQISKISRRIISRTDHRQTSKTVRRIIRSSKDNKINNKAIRRKRVIDDVTVQLCILLKGII